MTSLAGSATRLGPGAADYLDESFGQLRPFFTVPEGDNEKTLKWLQTGTNVCESYFKDTFSVQQDNVLIYKGIQWLNQDRNSNRFLDRNGVITRKSPKVVINHLGDLTEQWVSRLTRFRPAVDINPTNAEYEDKEDSRTAKYVLDHIWYQERVDNLLEKFSRMIKVTGEGHLFVEWDPNKGDVHPDFIEARKRNLRVPRLDQYGEPILSSVGDPMFIESTVRVGDIKYTLDAPWHIFEMPCRNRDEIDWCIRWKPIDVDYLKAKYPDKADKIYANSSSTYDAFPFYRLEGNLKNQIIQYEFFHRSSEFLDKGKYIRFTKDVILEETALPYSHGKLPYLYMCDIEVPDEIRGMSFFQQLFPLQFQLNACASLIYKALVLFAHPKIVMPDGACDITQLANESTIVSYRGGVPPVLMSNMPASQEAFTYMNKLEQSLEKISGIFSMSRGQAPNGVRAAKALRALEEQEDKRGYSATIRFNQTAIIDNAAMTLSVAGDFYKDTDGRLARVVGKNNQYLIRKFKAANLSKPYDIRIEASTALSKSPAARIQEISELQNVRFDPTAPFSREQFFNFLDFQNVDEMKDIATRSVMCAQSENEDLLSERFAEVKDPTPDEDLINHWKIHMQAVQSRDFKDMVPPPFKAALMKHIITTEYLMANKAFGDRFLGSPPNILFSQKMAMECPDWPAYFNLPAMPMMAGGMPGNPGMGAPMGAGVVGQPPTTDNPVPDPLMNGAEVLPQQTVAPNPFPDEGPIQ